MHSLNCRTTIELNSAALTSRYAKSINVDSQAFHAFDREITCALIELEHKFIPFDEFSQAYDEFPADMEFVAWL